MDTRLEMARRHQGEAQAAQTRGDLKHTLLLLDQAIDALGDDYRPPHTLDDTPMKLTLSKIEQGKDRLDTATALRHAVLESRLGMYAERHCGTGR